ncbi:MAG TPA: M56 family metallopeptidase [Candidatus Acidoferrales bacterium]|nr:M56 family metallopeptidase [Candidatus Acidoferrales bacterium]
MTPLVEFAVRFVATLLFNGLWQAGLLAVAAWAALRAFPNASATTRHAILSAAFYAGLALPVVTTCIVLAPAGGRPAASVRTATVPNAMPAPVVRSRAAAERLGTNASTFEVPAYRRPSLTVPRILAAAVVAAWLLGVAFVLVRLAASLIYLERLKRDALPVPIEYRARLERWAAAGKGRRDVRLCRSSEIVIPIAVGLFDAMILVPDRLLEDLDPQDVDRIVLHELAHLQRNDDWINAVERVAQALLFFNPGIIWLVGQLDLEREVACDDWVLQQNDALPYAHCLARVVETAAWPYRAMSAPGAFVTRRAMSVRIERLLSKHRDVRVSAAAGPTSFAVGALVALCVAAAFVAPTLAYAPSSGRSEIARHPKSAETVRVSRRAARSTAGPVRPAAAAEPSAPAPAPSLAPSASPSPAPPAVAHRPAIVARATAAPVPVATPASPFALPSVAIVAATDPDYVDELASVGYSGLSVDQLVELKAVGVTADYIRRLQAAGIAHPSVDDLVRMRAMRVSPEYIAAMRSQFGDSISLSDIASLSAVGVTPEYAQAMARAGVKNLDLDDLRSLKALEVTPDYIAAMARAGYPNLTTGDLQQLRAVGVDPAFVRRAADRGFRHLTVEQLVNLKVMGILP